MSKLTREQVLLIAMQAEEKLQAYYEILSGANGYIQDNKAAEFLAEFAIEEGKHYRQFEEMLLSIRAEGISGLEVSPEIIDLIERKVEPNFETLKRVFQNGSLTLDEALNLALETERDSIAFYKVILGMLEGEDDIKVVHMIIEEERKHERELLERLHKSQAA